MIQDIDPHIFNNAFANKTPLDNDRVLIFEEGTVQLFKTATLLSIPRYHEVLPLIEKASGDLLYLFSIDNTGYFLFATFTALPKNELHPKPITFFREMQPSWIAFAGVTGHQLYKWNLEHQFCGKCGHLTTPFEKERALQCTHCNRLEYLKFSSAVIVGITQGERLLLTKYSGGGYRNYALVAGYVEVGETLEEAARREVMEEVGLTLKNIRYYGNQPWAFSESLLIGFFAELEGDPTITLDETELSEAVWMRRDEIPPTNSSISLTANMIEAFRTRENEGTDSSSSKNTVF